MTGDLPRREWSEVLESMRYGKLYRIHKVCGDKYICLRCRMRGNMMVADKDERITVERKDHSNLKAEVGDFCFCDSGRPTEAKSWSLWKVVR